MRKYTKGLLILLLVFTFCIGIQVKADDRENLLADTMSVISDLKLQLSAVNANLAKDGYAFINIKVKITSVDNLNELMKKIKRLKGVIDVYRVNS